MMRLLVLALALAHRVAAQTCVSSACEEHSPGSPDGDCCSMPTDAFCADGHVYSQGEVGCGEGYTWGQVSTCCTPYTPVYGKGCNSYIHMDSFAEWGVSGGSTTLEQCAAAVVRANGRDGCRADYFFFEDGGYCNCPTDSCNVGANQNAGGSGQLYQFAGGAPPSTGATAGMLGCDNDRCSSYADDCCAPQPEAASCRDGYFTVRRDDHGGDCGDGAYTCCESSTTTAEELEDEGFTWEFGGACSMERCRSPNGEGGYDCIAGSEHEECSCSEGEAKETGITYYDEENDITYYEYTCCTDGTGVGEECGDFEHADVGRIIFFFIILPICIICCCIGIGIAICAASGVACFAAQQQQQQRVQPAGGAVQMGAVQQPVTVGGGAPMQGQVIQAAPMQGQPVMGQAAPMQGQVLGVQPQIIQGGVVGYGGPIKTF